MPVNEGLRDGIEWKATCATLQVAPKRLLLSDNGIIAARCLLLDAARANQTRGAVPGLDPASHRCRAASVIVPQDALAPVVSVVLLGNASLKPACGILGFRHPRYVDT